ncbi:hypothetical protein NE237_002402 [Protea cynaroides]|uniref:Uncharacterized protein n=1 Tax=Protea cynaroides TaxID=273540 RepID=A0A9Q0KVV0_9MAGN|nr:hypothetical protein NE237_002402 [Protea cynaroides]
MCYIINSIIHTKENLIHTIYCLSHRQDYHIKIPHDTMSMDHEFDVPHEEQLLIVHLQLINLQRRSSATHQSSTTIIYNSYLFNEPQPLLYLHVSDLSSLQCQIPLTDVSGNGFSSDSPDHPVVHLKGPPLPSVFEDDCLSPLPSYVHLDPSSPSCSFIDPILGLFLPGNLNARIHGDVSGVFASGNILMGSDLQPQELEFECDDCGVYGSDPMQQVYNSGDIQVHLSQRIISTT